MEKELAPIIPALNQFIEKMLAHYEEHTLTDSDSERDMDKLNQLFKQCLIDE